MEGKWVSTPSPGRCSVTFRYGESPNKKPPLVGGFLFPSQGSHLSNQGSVVEGAPIVEDSRLGCVRPDFGKIADLHRTIREASNNFQLPPHRLDMAAQGGNVHVGALFLRVRA